MFTQGWNATLRNVLKRKHSSFSPLSKKILKGFTLYYCNCTMICRRFYLESLDSLSFSFSHIWNITTSDTVTCGRNYCGIENVIPQFVYRNFTCFVCVIIVNHLHLISFKNNGKCISMVATETKKKKKKIKVLKTL